jgi:hypothetical protein
MKRETRSPLKDRPLRVPGQSVDERLMDLLYDKLLAPALIALMLLVFAGLEWWRHLFPTRAAPWLYTVTAVIAVGYAAFRFFRAVPEIRALKQGRDGERVVGQYLERLREKGYQVLHDVMGDGFNIDHVVIGPAGVFTVETKTFSKPASGEPKIEFDGETLRIAGYEPDRDPIVQAKAQASWLRELLSESCGRKFAVRPVVVFPGWYVEQGKGTTRELWVLNPKALPQFLEHEPKLLEQADVSLASYHLSRFIRTQPRTTSG